MEEKKNSPDKGMAWKIAAIAAGVLLLLFIGLFAGSVNKAKKLADENEQLVQSNENYEKELAAASTAPAQTEPAASEQVTAAEQPAERLSPEEILAHWNDSALAKQQLSEYVKDVTDENSPNFIPEHDRIAVFDLDGTLFSETNPCYFDHCLLLYRVLEDPDYTDKASDYELDTCAKILQWIQDGEYPENMDVDHGRCIASSFAGMTLREFEDYVEKFGSQPAPGYDGMTRGESLYLPMLEILDVLDEYGFTSYVVSGTDRIITRGGLRNTLPLPVNRIIGSDETLVATGQGDTDGLKYQFTQDDRLITGGDFIIKNLKMNKVSAIEREIGIHPVLSFGNTTGDQSMADYTLTNPKYRSLAFMLCCDDLDREYGKISKAEKMVELCGEHNWIPVSMKNDWTTIYAEGVVKDPGVGLDNYTKLYEEYKYRLDAMKEKALPEYEYPGPELFYTIVYDYLKNEFGASCADNDVCIPCPVIIGENDDDREDIRLYGNFLVKGYDLNGDCLDIKTTDGFWGCLHIKTTDEGYEVTDFEKLDVKEDPEFSSVDEIFDEYADVFRKSFADYDLENETMSHIIANYVYANSLEITGFQNEDWKKVSLPEQNIDSFYSVLDPAA
ncbi:MAG: haloacid dehalogenase-like hydrolase [Oscillospiraceae bacterium]|nr:haloacid dehalogenase-like hydrolase [Oscillospiraceae bacterium]